MRLLSESSSRAAEEEEVKKLVREKNQDWADWRSEILALLGERSTVKEALTASI